MFSGTVRTRDRLNFGRDGGEKVTAIKVFDGGSAVQRPSVSAGEIGKLWGLGEIQIGDAVGRSPAGSRAASLRPADARDGCRSVQSRRQGRAPRRARPARRAGPVDRRPAGRRPPGDCPSRSTARFRRRSSRRRWQATSASRSRSARRRRSASSGRSAPARRSRFSRRSRIPSSPRSDCGSTLRRPAPGSSSGCRSTAARRRCSSTRRPRASRST